MLDEYSEEQRLRLAQLRPHWISYSREYPYKDQPASYLLIEMSSPGDADEKLFVYTADGEITVSFGMWEWHYPEPRAEEQDELRDAISTAERIQSDELFIVSYWLGQKWLGSRILDQNDPLIVSDFAEGAKVAKVLSWSGRLTREIAL